ncbi:MAG: NAD(P)-binding domain-containing protein [Clostridiales bacterium]|nr:NAD(P)-binding domain-containing protein [Clostridiales bacterium]
MEVNSIGVIGAGQMGAGVAQVAAANGYKVILSVRSEKKGDLAISKMRSSMEKRVAAGKMSPDSLDTTLKNITSTAKQE